MAEVSRLGRRSSPFYLIPIFIGMAGVLFARQVEDPVVRATVVLMCMGIPLFVGGNVLARFSMDRTQRAVLLVGMAMLVVGALYTEMGYAEMFARSEFVSEQVNRTAQVLGLGSLMLGLITVLYAVVRSHAVMNELTERFRHVSEHMAEGFILTDEEGRIVRVNSSFVEMSGIPQEELVGQHAFDLAELLGAESMARHTKHHESGVASEYRVAWTRDGEERQYWVHGSPIYDRRGRRVGALATVRDITERERMSKQLADYAARLQELVDEQTEKLRASEQRQRNLLIHMNEGFVTLDAEQRIRFANQFICRTVGLPESRLQGARLTEFLAVEDRRRFESHLTSVADTEQPAPAQDYTLLSDNGDHIAVNISIASVEDDRENGTVWSLVITDVQELTEMQRQRELRAQQLEEANEELRRLDRAKDVFLSNVSHELRTPLSTVQGYIEMLDAGDFGEVPAPQAGALKVMERNVERLGRLINEMIAFSRMEITGVRLNKTLFRPETLVAECVSSAEPQAIQKNVSINFHAEPDLQWMWGDREKLCQVLSILLSNAIKFSPSGALVQVRVEPDGDNGVAFAVADTGIGIAPEHQDRVFMKFYQIDSSHTRRYQGTGIGLSIAKSIVEAHGGGIDLKSAVKKGSTFTAHFPDTLFQCRAQAEPAQELEGAFVRVATDQAEFADAVATCLQRQGCEVETFERAHECARVSAEEVPDVIVVDEALDDLSGPDLIALLREDLRTHDTPIVLLTSAPEVSTNGHQMTGRVWELRKPFSPQQLVMKALKVCALSGEIGEALAADADKTGAIEDEEPRAASR